MQAAVSLGKREDSTIGLIRDLRRRKTSKLLALLLPGFHQIPNKTSLDRYPEIFAAAVAAVPEARRILSFGCSTGEECVTLASYFPGALIVGTDINPLNLLKAMKHRNDRIRFVYAIDRILSGFGGFDAVFCMAVLRTSKRDLIAEHYPFDRFEERALFLKSLVRPGGILVIHNGTYRFSDTAYRCAYEPIPMAAIYDKVYLPDGVTQAKPDGGFFRKLKPEDTNAMTEVRVEFKDSGVGVR